MAAMSVCLGGQLYDADVKTQAHICLLRMEHKALQSEAGYIDARPQADRSMKPSCDARLDHTYGAGTGLPSQQRVRQINPNNHTR
jgi:hypothetical protein